MKKTFAVIIALILFVAASPVLAQTPTVDHFQGKSLMVSLPATTAIAGVVTVTSDVFTMAGFDGAGTSPAWYYGKIYTALTGKPHITVTLEGTYDLTNYVAFDTLGALRDSATTFSNGPITHAGTGMFPYYRFKLTGETGNSAVAKAYIALYAIKPD